MVDGYESNIKMKLFWVRNENKIRIYESQRNGERRKSCNVILLLRLLW